MDENTIIGSGIVSEAIKNACSAGLGLSDVTNTGERNLLQGGGPKRNELAQQVRGVGSAKQANVHFARKSSERAGSGRAGANLSRQLQ